MYAEIDDWHLAGGTVSDSHGSAGIQRLHTSGVRPIGCLGKWIVCEKPLTDSMLSIDYQETH